VGEKLLPAFPNAVYWSNEEHWTWAVEPNDREKASFLKENILPIKESGQLQFIDLPYVNGSSRNNWMSSPPENILRTPFNENIDLRFVSGHTNSMMLPQIRYNDKTIVFMADLLPAAAHIPLPYVMAYDMFPLTTLTEKRLFLEEAVRNDYILFFEHDPQIECCTLQLTDRGIRSHDVFTLAEL
jgi:hypothetical protein